MMAATLFKLRTNLYPISRIITDNGNRSRFVCHNYSTNQSDICDIRAFLKQTLLFLLHQIIILLPQNLIAIPSIGLHSIYLNRRLGHHFVSCGLLHLCASCSRYNYSAVRFVSVSTPVYFQSARTPSINHQQPCLAGTVLSLTPPNADV